MKATDLFNYRKEDFETIESFSKYVDGATPTFSDGTRSFDWDGRSYVIEAEEVE